MKESTGQFSRKHKITLPRCLCSVNPPSNMLAVSKVPSQLDSSSFSINILERLVNRTKDSNDLSGQRVLHAHVLSRDM